LGRQRCCQVNAGCCVGPPDETGSQGTSADVEVAVAATAGVCAESAGEVRRFAETRPGTGTVGRHRGRCRRCRRESSWRVSDVAVAVAVAERERPPGVRAVRRTGSTETSVRPASASVGTATSGKEPGGRPTARTIWGVRQFPCCVIVFAIVVWQCYFATELVIC